MTEYRRRTSFQRSWKQRSGPRSHREGKHSTSVLRSPKVQAVILVVLIVTWISILSYYSFFQIQHIVISRPDQGEVVQYQQFVEEQLSKTHLLSLRSNFFLFSKENLATKLHKRFPVATLEINTVFPKTLHITLTEEKDEILVYAQQSLWHYFTNGERRLVPDDKTPYVQEVVPAAEPPEGAEEGEVGEATTQFSSSGTYLILRRNFPDLPVVFSPDAPEDYVSEFAQEILHFTTQVTLLFSEEGVVGNDQWFFEKDPHDIYQLKVTSIDGWKIFFDTRFDLASQLEKLKRVLRTDPITTFSEIDVRFEETVFLKRKDT